jgi:DNA-binding beta-propeller fold protein YncE
VREPQGEEIEKGGAMSAARVIGATICAVLATAALAIVGVCGASAAVTYEGSFGSPGSGAGQLLEPTGVAVDESNGDVLVADTGNDRVVRFDEDGNFISTWGRGVDQTDSGDICTAASGDLCGAGSAGEQAGAFDAPRGIGVDPATGSVYVQDGGNNRVQKLGPEGEFILLWGKSVDQQNGGDVCTAASHHTCQAGAISSDPGGFGGWPATGVGGFSAPDLTVGDDGSVYVVDPGGARVERFGPGGEFISQAAPSGVNGAVKLRDPGSPGVSADGHVYAIDDDGADVIVKFDPADLSADGGAPYRQVIGRRLHLSRMAVDPSTGYLFALGTDCAGVPGKSGTHLVEFHPAGQEVDCTVPSSPSIDGRGGMAISSDHELYIGDPSAGRVRVFRVPAPEPPAIATAAATQITSAAARIAATVSANLADTTVHVEYGTQPCPSSACLSTPESASIGGAIAAVPVSQQLTGLAPDTTYHYRLIASNAQGTVSTGDRVFTTFATPTFDASCANNLARQQTGAAFLFDCRAYELVSAPDQGGYDVESDLLPGGAPFGGYPDAPGRALYAIHNGGIPGAGRSTNRGPDPYLAVRDAPAERWDTTYVGIPADAPSDRPFSSTVSGADPGLRTFAFSGPEICDPCFADGSSGVPVRRPDGSLVQGMVGPIPVPDPVPAGEVREPFSADGTHFVFGSKQQFTADGNASGTDVTIYDRNFATGTTRVVSKSPGATTIENGDGVAELGISSDGSRVLIGERVGADLAGNPLWHLYMHVGGAPNSIDLMPGAVEGGHLAGMNAAGTVVFFTTADSLANESSPDTDTSADLYRAEVGPSSAALTRVSASPTAGDTDACAPTANSARPHWNTLGSEANCDVVAVGGGGGVASSGDSVYFLSPEQLDGSAGVAGAPNMYLSKDGAEPRFVTTLESSADLPLRQVNHLFQGSYGSFSYPEGVAIDRATGSTYVFDTVATTGRFENEKNEEFYVTGSYLQRFEPSGEPDLTFGADSKVSGSPFGPFKESGSGTFLSKIGVATQIAVDNSSGPSKGSIYVPDFYNRAVVKLSQAGKFVTEFSPGVTVLPSGAAVDSENGDVYVTGYQDRNVYRFDSEGNHLAPPSFPVTGNPLGLAVGAGHRVYVANGSNLRVYSATGTFLEVLDPHPSFGVAVDPADDHVYVDEGNHVVEFDAAGKEVGEGFGGGVLSSSISLAADSGQVTVSNPDRGKVSRFGAPQVPPDSRYDSPLAIDSVSHPEARRTADFQIDSDGRFAVFPSTRPLDGFDAAGHREVYRYGSASGGGPVCVSCSPTQAQPESDATLASNGLSVTDDGRVFFTTGESLVLRDSNSRKDAYEWKNGAVELISSGQSDTDSGLLSATADGSDAFFFTRATLAPADHNGNLMKVYDARAGGGFYVIPPPPGCAASDECHGVGSAVPPPPDVGTVTGTGGNLVPSAEEGGRCRKGTVRRGRRCVRKHRPRHHRHRSGGSGRGGRR